MWNPQRWNYFRGVREPKSGRRKNTQPAKKRRLARVRMIFPLFTEA
jgi:hypothetical protein